MSEDQLLQSIPAGEELTGTDPQTVSEGPGDPPSKVTPEQFDQKIKAVYDRGTKKYYVQKNGKSVELDPSTLKEGDIIHIPVKGDQVVTGLNGEKIHNPKVEAMGDGSYTPTGYRQLQGGKWVNVSRPQENKEEEVRINYVAPGKAVPTGEKDAQGNPKVKYIPYKPEEITLAKDQFLNEFGDDKTKEDLTLSLDAFDRYDGWKSLPVTLAKNKALAQAFAEEIKAHPDQSRTHEGRYSLIEKAIVKAGGFDQSMDIAPDGTYIDHDEVKVHYDRLNDPKLRGEYKSLYDDLTRINANVRALTKQSPAFDPSLKSNYDKLKGKIDEYGKEEALLKEGAAQVSDPRELEQIRLSFSALRRDKNRAIEELNSIAQTLKSTSPEVLKNIASMEAEYRSKYSRLKDIQDQFNLSKEVLDRPQNKYFLDLANRRQGLGTLIATLRQHMPLYDEKLQRIEDQNNADSDKWSFFKKLETGTLGIIAPWAKKFEDIASGAMWGDKKQRFESDANYDDTNLATQGTFATPAYSKHTWGDQFKKALAGAGEALPSIALGAAFGEAQALYGAVMSLGAYQDNYMQGLSSGMSEKAAMLKGGFNFVSAYLSEHIFNEGDLIKSGFHPSDELLELAMKGEKAAAAKQFAKEYIQQLPDTLRTHLKEVGMEHLEDVANQAMDGLINYGSNELAGTKFDVQLIKPLKDQLESLAALTIAMTGMKAAVKAGEVGRVKADGYQDSILHMALSNPQGTHNALDIAERLSQDPDFDPEAAKRLQNQIVTATGVKFPSNYTIGQKVQATKILTQIKEWEGELKGADPRFQESIQKRIDDLNRQLDDISKNPEKADKETEKSIEVASDDVHQVAQVMNVGEDVFTPTEEHSPSEVVTPAEVSQPVEPSLEAAHESTQVPITNEQTIQEGQEANQPNVSASESEKEATKEVAPQTESSIVLPSVSGQPVLSIEDESVPEEDKKKTVSDRLRNLAAMIEGDKHVLKSDLLALPKAVVSTLLKGAATIIETAQTAKEGIGKAVAHMVNGIKEHYKNSQSQAPSDDEIFNYVRAKFQETGIDNGELEKLFEQNKGSRKKPVVESPIIEAMKRGVKAMYEQGMDEKEIVTHLQETLKVDKDTAKGLLEDMKSKKLTEDQVTASEEPTTKQKVAASTDSRVKNQIVMTELQALKHQTKTKFRAMAQGFKMGAKDMKAKWQQADLARKMMKDGLDAMLKNLQRQGQIPDQVGGKIANSLMRQINKASTPRQFLKLLNRIDKYIENANYDADLAEAGKIRSDIKKSVKSKRIAANNVGAVREFLSINPDHVSNLAEYREVAKKVLATLKGVKLGKHAQFPTGNSRVAPEHVSLNPAVMDQYTDYETRNEEYQISTNEIDQYVKEQAQYAQEQADAQFIEDYRDLVDAGILDVQNMSVDEMREIVKAIQGVEDEDDLNQLMAEKIGENQKKLEALRTMVAYRQDALQDYWENNKDNDLLSKKKKEILQQLVNTDIDSLGAADLARYNDVINNILYNGSFAGTGQIAVLGQKNANKAKLKELIKNQVLHIIPSSGFRGTISGFTKGASSSQLIYDFINTKSSKLAAEMQRLMGVMGIFDANARAKKTYTETVNAYDKLKEKLGKAMDSPLNRYARGVYARIIQHYGGTEQERQEEFDRVKFLIKQTGDKLLASAEKSEQKEGALIQQVYDRLLEGSSNADEVKVKMDDANLQLVQFWLDRHADMRERFLEHAEIYNNELPDEVENYSATRLRTYSGTPEEARRDDVLNTLLTRRSVDNRPAGSKFARQTMQTLGSRVLDLDFDHVQSQRYFENLYDMEAGEHLSLARAFFSSSDAAEVMGGMSNRNLTLKSLERSIKAQRGIVEPMEEAGQAAQKLMQSSFAKGVRVALGGIDQLFTQYLPVMINTWINLGFNAAHLMRVPWVGQKAKDFEKLISQFNIINRGATKAGFNRDVDFNAIDRVDFNKNQESNGSLLSRLFEGISKAIMWPLEHADVAVARRSWGAFYLQDLQRQGFDVSNINWAKEAENPNTEAAAYAEQMISRNQNPNDISSMPSLMQQRGLGAIAKNIMLPFSSFSLNTRLRLTADVHRLLFDKRNGEAWKSIGATLAEQIAFNGLKVYMLSPIINGLMVQCAKALGSWDDEDEKNRHKFDQVDIHTALGTVHTNKDEKKWVANTIVDFFFSGIGQPLTEGLQFGMNKIYQMGATETYPDAKDKETGEPFTEKHPQIFWTPNDGQVTFNNFGVYSAVLQNAYNILQDFEPAVLGKTDRYEGRGADQTTTKTHITPQERKVALVNIIVDLFALLGASEREVTRVNQKLRQLNQKKMLKKYGGKDVHFKTSAKGSGEEGDATPINE